MANTSKLKLLLVDANWQFADDAFNKVIKDADDKLVGIAHLQGAAHWAEWKKSASYVVGDVVRWVNMKSDQYAKCVTAGVSGAVSPTNNVVGSIVTDNTVEWKVCSLSAEGSSISITIWLSGTNYSKGDFVIYGTSLYRCRVSHTSSIWVTDYINWTEVFSSVRMWQPSIYYFVNDTVMYNRMLWQCLQAHTSNTSFNATEESKWACITPKGIEDWETSTNYEVDDIVIYNNVLYRCIANHTSDSSDFMNDRATNWKLFHTPNATINSWAAGNYYENGQMVYYENRLYKCISSHMSTTFSADFNKWQIEYSNIKDWTSSVYYKVGTTVLYDNIPYKCVSAHTSSTFTNDESNWEIIYSSIKLWSPSTFYKEGIVVINDGNFYKCVTSHTSSSSFYSDAAKWELLVTGITDWTSGNNYIVGQFVVYNGVLYECTTANSDTTFDPTNWQKIAGGGLDTWTANTSYSVGDIVINANKIYQCNTAHTSSSTFTPDANNWTEISACITRIPNWEADTEYVVGDLVAHDAKIYRCITAHTSDPTQWDSVEEANWEELSPTINEISTWAVSTDYEIGQLVIHDNKLYKCNTAHTSDSTSFNTDIAYWDAIGASGIDGWKTGEAYQQGNMVVYNDKIYVCDTAHTSANPFDYTKWHEVSTADITLWNSNVEYLVGNNVIYNNKLYRCTTAHTSGSTFDSTKWDEISPYDIGLWQASTAYKVGNLVINDNQIYRCKTAHTSSSTFNSDITNWDILDTKWQAKYWTTNTYYLVGEVVLYNNTPYRCTTSHTSLGTFELDKTNWEPLSANIRQWVSGTTYKVGDTVIYDNKLYKCITNNNDGVFERAKWNIVPRPCIEVWKGAANGSGYLGVFHFDDPSDVTKNSIDGSSYTFTISGSGALADGRFGKYLQYYSGNPLVFRTGSLPFTSGTEIYTIEFWMYVNFAYNVVGLVPEEFPTIDGEVSADIVSFTHFKFNFNSGSSSSQYTCNAWHHFAFVISNSDIKMYGDGVLNGTYQRANPGSSTYLYGYKSNNADTFKVSYDELYVSNIARYTSNFDISSWNPVEFNYEGYKVNDLVVYNDKIYRCITDNNDSVFTPSKWVEVSKSLMYPDWESSTSYSIGDIVLYNGRFYKCTTAHTSSTFNNDYDKWAPMDKNCFIFNWSANIPYYVDEVVKYDSGLYRCKTQHISLEPPINAKLYESTTNVIEVDNTTTIPYTETIDIGSIQKVTDIDYTESTTDMSFTYTIETSDDNIVYTRWTEAPVNARYIKLTVDSVNIVSGATSPKAYLDNFTVYGDNDKWEKISSGGCTPATSAQIQSLF